MEDGDAVMEEKLHDKVVGRGKTQPQGAHGAEQEHLRVGRREPLRFPDHPGIVLAPVQ